MAKAELSEIKIDMNSVTTLKDFKCLVKKEETQNFIMFIIVNTHVIITLVKNFILVMMNMEHQQIVR